MSITDGINRTDHGVSRDRLPACSNKRPINNRTLSTHAHTKPRQSREGALARVYRYTNKVL